MQAAEMIDNSKTGQTLGPTYIRLTWRYRTTLCDGVDDTCLHLESLDVTIKNRGVGTRLVGDVHETYARRGLWVLRRVVVVHQGEEVSNFQTVARLMLGETEVASVSIVVCPQWRSHGCPLRLRCEIQRPSIHIANATEVHQVQNTGRCSGATKARSRGAAPATVRAAAVLRVAAASAAPPAGLLCRPPAGRLCRLPAGRPAARGVAYRRRHRRRGRGGGGHPSPRSARLLWRGAVHSPPAVLGRRRRGPSSTPPSPWHAAGRAGDGAGGRAPLAGSPPPPLLPPLPVACAGPALGADAPRTPPRAPPPVMAGREPAGRPRARGASPDGQRLRGRLRVSQLPPPRLAAPTGGSGRAAAAAAEAARRQLEGGGGGGDGGAAAAAAGERRRRQWGGEVAGGDGRQGGVPPWSRGAVTETPPAAGAPPRPTPAGVARYPPPRLFLSPLIPASPGHR